jgi:CubicO group peptidase (beta-lactamase class C family)
MRARTSGEWLAALTLMGCLGGSLAPAPADGFAASTVIRGALGARLDSIVIAAEKDGFHGVVLVAEGGREILERGCGLANRETGARFSPETVVQIGSNVKDFTRVAIFQLVEAGKLRLDDTLARFFPNAPADRRGITIDQLLEHRAGMPLGLAADEFPLTRDAFLQRFWTTPLVAAPGEKEHYSNAGYSMLALIVERLSGESFDTYVARAILAPAGLRETGLLGPRFDASRIAHGYLGGVDQGTMLDRPHDDTGHLWSLRGNGGYLATARDQVRFYRALRGDGLLKRRELRERAFSARGTSILSGSDSVCYFAFANFPSESLDVVIASNHSEYEGRRVLDAFEAVVEDAGRRRMRERSGRPATAAQLPAGGPWQTVRGWYDAFQSGDERRMRTFLETHSAPNPDSPPMERRIEVFHMLREDLGDLTVVETRTTSEGFEVDVDSATGRRALLSFVIEPKAPHRLVRLSIGVED